MILEYCTCFSISISHILKVLDIENTMIIKLKFAGSWSWRFQFHGFVGFFIKRIDEKLKWINETVLRMKNENIKRSFQKFFSNRFQKMISTRNWNRQFYILKIGKLVEMMKYTKRLKFRKLLIFYLFLIYRSFLT